MRFIHRETVGSTQDEARALYEQGERGPIWVIAEAQTKGRGRRARSWTSETGNLYASGLYPTKADAAHGALFGFATALAMAETVEHYDVEADVTLKWPNDVLVGGAKISGILIEREPEALIVGTGLNLISHPPDTPYPATHLLAEMRSSDFDVAEPPFTGAPAVGALLASNILKWFKTLENDGFAPVREAWLQSAHHLGKMVSVNGQTGIFSDLAMDGALCLTLADGKESRVHAGDVSFG